MKICGIEEAGRGPVIGPLVMVGVLIDEEDEQKLVNLKVKDSKLLTPKQRKGLYEKIIQIVENYKIIMILPNEIDAALKGGDDMNLNWLEAQRSAQIINELRPDKVILDCPSPNKKEYAEYLARYLENKTEIIAEHKADVKYPLVSAASIIAKVSRDREVERIKEEYDIDFGSGYPADPKTKEFIEKNYNKYPFFRTSWSTYKKIAKKAHQKTLKGF